MTRKTVFFSFLAAFLAVWWYWSKAGTITETFHGKNVIITGASSGIGEQLAYRYSQQGANVLVVARRQKALEKVMEQCKVHGAVSVKYITADLSNIEDTKRFAREAQEYFENTIDVLVLNHVFYTNVQAWDATGNIDDAIQMFNTNVISYINLATLFLTSLQTSSGRLVVISSGLGVFTFPYLAVYSSNKHALHGFFDTLRQEININKTDNGGMSITITVLGAISTENALKVSKGNPVAGENGWPRFSPEDASLAVMKASLRRDRKMYFPFTMRLHEVLNFWFPSYIESIIRYSYDLR